MNNNAKSTKHIVHFWYSEPPRRRLALNIRLGDVLVELRWNENEMRTALKDLAAGYRCDGASPNTIKDGETRVWDGWEYTQLENPPDWEPPVVIYRDDFFLVTLPPYMRDELREVLTERLAEIAGLDQPRPIDSMEALMQALASQGLLKPVHNS